VIVGSVLLILGAVVLLGLGLVDGSSALLIGSIAVSLLAAVTLVVGARQAAAARAELIDDVTEPGDRAAFEPAASGLRRPPVAVREPAEAAARVGESRVALAEPPARTVPTQPAAPDEYATGPRREAEPVGYEPAPEAAAADQEYEDEDPPDEPAPQAVSTADAARVARMTTDVLVIDGRPRYHLPGCVHLLGRESEPLPVSEAVELGFTPCSLCEPDNALLAEARRV
jgi:hypothetical protein